MGARPSSSALVPRVHLPGASRDLARAAAVPVLSVVIARVDERPRVRECLASLMDQARAVGAEVILAEGVSAGLPEAEFPDLVRIREPGSSVYRLRALGLLRSRGEVVAFTEDHCRVGAGWCQALIEAHREEPEAGVIGGVVENGATRTLLDWAHFLIPSARFLPPLPSGPTAVMPGSANLSFKRRVIPAQFPAIGVMEMLFTRELAARGERMVCDGRLRVTHDQPVGPGLASALHFHSGRSVAAFRLPRMEWPERLGRLLGCAVLPPVMLARTLAAALSKADVRWIVAASVPLMVWLLCCHAAGEVMGYVFGPGDSPARLH